MNVAQTQAVPSVSPANSLPQDDVQSPNIDGLTKNHRELPKESSHAAPALRPRLKGRKFGAGGFRVQHVKRVFDREVLHSLLAGNAVAMHIHNYLTDSEADALAKTFRTQVRKQRGDDVPAAEIGTGHYGKTLEEYLHASAASRADLQGVWDKSGLDLSARLEADLQAALEPGQQLRTAQHEGRKASELRAVAWQGGSNGLKLQAHEDVSQLSQDSQAGFELQTVRHPVAINVYADVPKDQGALRVWNLQPSLEMRHSLGLQQSGYPYPADLLTGVEHLDLQPEPGDCIIAFGSMLHGVLDFSGALSRVVYNGFIGLSPDSAEVLRWT